jgi:pantothenate kinase-related protein Tda10
MVQLVAVNKNLAAYNDAWHKMIDSWIIIQVGDPHWVYKWRQQAEARMRADGGSGMTDEQVRCTSCLPGAKNQRLTCSTWSNSHIHLQ